MIFNKMEYINRHIKEFEDNKKNQNYIRFEPYGHRISDLYNIIGYLVKEIEEIKAGK